MSISLIRAQNPQGVVTDGYILSLKAKDLDELIGDQVRAVRELETNWQGTAANAARARAYRDIQRQHRMHEILAAMASRDAVRRRRVGADPPGLLAWVESVSATTVSSSRRRQRSCSRALLMYCPLWDQAVSRPG